MSDGAHLPLPAPAAAVRVQLLATEHWSLLATRSMTWSEVMSHITIHLTVTSAALVVLALVVQASGFGSGFRVLAIGLASVVLLLGTLTAVRVRNASIDDHALIAGMNRLRAAYVEIDPSVADYLVTSWHDDMAGVMRTSTLGVPRGQAAHVIGSTNLFMSAINTIVAGTLGALVASAAGGSAWVDLVVGTVAAAVYLLASLAVARRSFSALPLIVRFPTSIDDAER